MKDKVEINITEVKNGMTEKQAFKKMFLDTVQAELAWIFDTKEDAVLIQEHSQGIAYLCPFLDAHATAHTISGDRNKLAENAGQELAYFLIAKVKKVGA